MTQEPAGVTSPQIASYYDLNTERFLRYGGSQAEGAIHRQIWAPGVKNKRQALEYLNHLVAVEIEPLLGLDTGISKVLDLGCGVGGTATWLAEAMDVQVLGITNSVVQHQLAVQRAEELYLADHCRFILADYSEFTELGRFNAVYMIEVFTHAPNAGSLPASIWEHLLPGGRLVIADDFRGAGVNIHEAVLPSYWLQQFQRGWQLNSLLSRSEIIALADQFGFRLIKELDLTPFLRILPWYLLKPATLFSRLPFHQVYWQNLKGGLALQYCNRQGWTKYHFLVWEKE
mgnify:CR=1 FL=1